MNYDINNQFVDYDLERVPVDIGLDDSSYPNASRTGWIDDGTDDEELFGAMDYETAGGIMVPQSEWKDRCEQLEEELRKNVVHVLNQRNEGSCVANAGAGCFNYAAHLKHGAKNFRKVSAIYVYSFIGRSPGSGSYMGDCARHMADIGTIPLTEDKGPWEHAFAPTGFYDCREYRRKNNDCLTTAKHFRSRWVTVQGLDQWISAELNACPIMYGRSGHSIYNFLPKFRGNDLFFGFSNSWSSSWGDFINEKVGKGLGWDSSRIIRNLKGWALLSITERDELIAGVPDGVKVA